MSIISWDEFQKRTEREYELTIRPGELRLGDFVVRVEAISDEVVFPEHGLRVETFVEKMWFRNHCRRVVIDLSQSINRQPTGTDGAMMIGGRLPTIAGSLDALRRRRISASGLVAAWPVYREMSLNAQSLILSFHRHGQVDLEATGEAIDGLIDALDDHLASLLWLARIKETSRYPFQHGLRVAVLGAAFAFAAGWDRNLISVIALSGLLHDLGMMRVDLKLLNKAGPLSPEELGRIRLHTRFGHELLSQNEDVPMAVAQAVLRHHERPDGKGYPDGQAHDSISGLAMLIGLIDAYDAMTSTRVHRPAMSHQQALGEIWRQRNLQFDGELAGAFSRFLGWAPPGCLMRLPVSRVVVALHASEGAGLPVVAQLHRRDEDVEFGAMIDLGLQASGSAFDGKAAVLLPDGYGQIVLRDLTRKLPRLLATDAADRAQARLPDHPRQERRRRARIDAPRGTRILVADDSTTVRKTLDNMLASIGYRVLQAGDGRTALALADAEAPDLIILDIVLPDLNGFRAIRKLRSSQSTRNIPVVMISGNSDAVDQFFLERVGADDFIQKPFGRHEVFSAIERLIRSGALPLRAPN
ncbi:MAG: response regulator [Wenzhouxiangella sp.]|nr:response regulator [Wenzhouxiangella sp.]